MFEVGRRYKITTSDHEGQSYTVAEVQDWQPPLLKIERLGSYEVINTSSPAFVSAEPQDAASEEAKTAAARNITDSFSLRSAHKSDE